MSNPSYVSDMAKQVANCYRQVYQYLKTNFCYCMYYKKFKNCIHSLIKPSIFSKTINILIIK